MEKRHVPERGVRVRPARTNAALRPPLPFQPDEPDSAGQRRLLPGRPDAAQRRRRLPAPASAVAAGQAEKPPGRAGYAADAVGQPAPAHVVRPRPRNVRLDGDASDEPGRAARRHYAYAGSRQRLRHEL